MKEEFKGKMKRVIISTLFVISLFLIAGCAGKYDDFATCLTEKGVSMGGTDWCPYCKEQKAKFGSSFKYVDYHNCDIEKEWCINNNVKGYPTWVMPDGKTYPGVMDLFDLSRLSGCDL